MRRVYREIIIALGAIISAVASVGPGSVMGPINGFFYDLSLATIDIRPGSGDEPVAIIALDRDSLQADELAAIPRVLLGPIWAKLINGLDDIGVRAIGFDIIFEYSADRFPELTAGYDKGFREALARVRSRVVLARSAYSYPALPFIAAVTDINAGTGPEEAGAIAYVDLMPDTDGVQRWVTPKLLTVGGRSVSTLSAALLNRAHTSPMPERLLLAPAVRLETIPTYRLIDVLRCLERDPAALRDTFAGKIILIGGNLPEEDRKRTPDRFMPLARARTDDSEKCGLNRLGSSDPNGGTTPGVFIHAAAVQSVLTGNIVNPLPPAAGAAAAAVMSIAGSLLGFITSPWTAVFGVVALAIACFGIGVGLVPFGIWFPVAVPGAAAVISMVLAYLVRFFLEERRRRRVQNAFSHYLAPSIVNQLAESEAELHLGGERREITVMFADLSGFTAFSSKVEPEVLTEVTNNYLRIIVEAVEATGGYVDKFIGDAVMAIWGAPVANPDHAACAARGALRVFETVVQAKANADATGAPGFTIKISLNTGPAVVGNVGAPMRYNYTAVGETVNIAARLESVPTDYGCWIVIGPQTAKAIADRFVVCELDLVRVKGKDNAIAVYELIGEKAQASIAELAYPAQYYLALKRYRDGDFVGAEECWRHHVRHPHFFSGTIPSPPAIMARRCGALKAAPPKDWDGVFVKALE